MHMEWRSGRYPVICIVLFILVASPAVFAGEEGRDASNQEVVKPIVRVLSPGQVTGSSDPTFGGAAFVMGEWAGTRILIVLEVIDATGAGIETNDRGEPRFLDANKNVDLFVGHIDTGTYTDGQGRHVIQIVSKVPIENLKTGDHWLTPPVDLKGIPREAREKGFTFPMQAMVEAFDFNFIVEDRNGVRSEPSRLLVAYADGFYRGPFDTGDEEALPEPKD